MVTMDVNALFTNVPLLETIAIIRQIVEEKNIHVGLPADELEKLLLLCTHNVKFSFLVQVWMLGHLHRQNGETTALSNKRAHPDLASANYETSEEVFHQIPRQRLRALTPQRLSRKERQKQVLLAASTTALVMAQYDAFGGLPHKNDKMITADHPYTRQRNDVCLIPNCSSQSHEQSAFDGLSSYRGISWHNDAVQNEITGIFQGDLGNYPRELELKWKSKAFDMDSPHDVLTLNKLNLNRDANESPTQFHLDRRDALHSDLKSECSNSTESEEAYVQMSPDRLETCLPFEHPVLVEAAEDQDSEVPNFPPELNMIRQEFRFNSRVPEKSPENMVECKPGGSLQQQLQQLPRVTQNEVLPPPSKLYGAANCLNFASSTFKPFPTGLSIIFLMLESAQTDIN
ncbi:unnamed protein product [Echinostoma caproni]|uniref:Reverse transcriptase domain-containing protein n=1 Tax=Echinostoma caproni TaxID=27848 RepID=A0A183AIQ1_9TREM|nr:unnamed protein product [Echinostoma caproni]